jgi:seryl-tRNA synthetase
MKMKTPAWSGVFFCAYGPQYSYFRNPKSKTMLTLQYLREHKEKAIERLDKRANTQLAGLVEQALKMDIQHREVLSEVENLQAEINKASKEIGEQMKTGAHKAAASLKEKVADTKSKLQLLKSNLTEIEADLNATLYQIPNAPDPRVVKGRSHEDNEEVHRNGNLPKLHPGAVPHWELASKYSLIDFELGVKITGAGFPVYTGKGARLQRALINFFLDEATAAGYLEVMPPLVVNEDSGIGTGQLPDKEGQMYYIAQDDLYLIPTAEVPITNMFRDVILDETDLPIKRCGYTPCFRREAGSYGKDVRGLNRLHQFDKVEIVEIAHPEHSYATLEAMVEHVKGLLEKLELPYRILRLCGGDMGFASAMTYDFEVYSAAQDKWLEVSSVSNFENFQSNRLKCRYRPTGEKKTALVHTLNGSALALPRIMAALLENFQDEKGINIPEALRPFTGFSRIEV